MVFTLKCESTKYQLEWNPVSSIFGIYFYSLKWPQGPRTKKMSSNKDKKTENQRRDGPLNR